MEASQQKLALRGSPAIEPMLITIEDLQRLLGCGKTKAFELLAQGEIEAVHLGRRRMATLESAKAYVERLRASAKPREAA